MKKIHVDKWLTDKCWKCDAVGIDGSCLIKNNDKIEPPKCKDGTCNLTIIRSARLFRNYKKEAPKI